MSATYFGFGSLVSRASIAVPVVSIEPARIFGHRRVWCQPFYRNGLHFAALGLEAGSATDYVDGVCLTVDDEHAAYFDERESGYRQVEIDVMHADGRVLAAVTFEAREHASIHAYVPVSYLATVVVGFWDFYGCETGLGRFIENTFGWERPIAFDLRQPVYSRRPHNLVEVAERIRPALEVVSEIVDL